MKIKSILLGIFFLGTFIHAEPVTLQNHSVVHSFTGKVYVWEDPSNSQKMEDILAMDKEKFTLYPKETINFGITPSTFWVLIEIENHSSESDWFLEVAAPSIDKIHYYIHKKDSIFHAIAGDEETPLNAIVKPNFTYFPLKLYPTERGKLLISFQSHEIIESPIRILNESTFRENEKERDFFQGIYFGMILIMAFYNLFLFFNLKDSAYLFYVLYIVGVGSLSAYFSGYFQNHTIIYYSNLISVFTGVFSILFTIRFLGTKLNNSRINWILMLYIFLYTVSFLAEMIGFRRWNSGFVYFVSMSLSFVLMFSGAYIYKRNHYIPARYYTISWFAFIVGLNIQILRAMGIFSYNGFTSHAMQIGNILEILLLSFALADRINQYKKDFEESRERAINALNSNRKLIEEQNKILEEKVTERTKIIEEQKLELQTKNNLLLKEIELAGRFQQTLLPNKPEVIPRVQLGFLYQPMLGVGGDFIDILYERESNYLGLFICDVTGHGITASLIASMVKISLQGWNQMIRNPALIPEHIRNNLKDKLDKNFVTSGICSLDLDNLILRYASAGHPPLVYIPANGKAEYIHSKGRAIGSFFTTACLESEISLQTGDKIVLYTDGVVEARNRRGVMLGEELFLAKLDELKTLAPREMTGELSAFMEKYTGGIEPQDDMTLLVMEIEY